MAGFFGMKRCAVRIIPAAVRIRAGQCVRFQMNIIPGKEPFCR